MYLQFNYNLVLLKKILLIFILFVGGSIQAQSGFKFTNAKIEEQRVRFQLINNLVVIPLEINGKQLSFILDTGVNKTILFNLTENDSIGLKNVERVTLRGLGSGEPVEALISKNNKFRIKDLVSNNEDLYVILKDKFDISAKMGVTIHGIIGYSLLKDVIVKINYRSKYIDFYNPKTYTYSRCRKCDVFPLEFYRNKPYLEAKVQLDTVGEQLTDVKMLIDSGGSDALWLFEDTKEVIKTPKKFFKDILGEGLSGTIYGNRSRVKTFHLGKFKFKEPTVSFLDSVSTYNARKFKKRNGSIGGNILKRFKVWIDYPNKKLRLRKNGSLRGGFYYNMSGISVVYNGMELIKEEKERKMSNLFIGDNEDRSNTTVSYVVDIIYKYKFTPSYKVDKVVEGSPAHEAGIQKGDVIKKINGRPTHKYTLEEIIGIFQSKPNKRIKMIVDRNGDRFTFKFRLKKRI